jgi:DNA helicase HerA-like ATPase
MTPIGEAGEPSEAGQRWSALHGLAAYRITEIPRQNDTGITGAPHSDNTDPARPQRTAALTAAYHAGIAGTGMIAFGWIRPQTGGPVHIITAGDTTTGSALTNGDVLLSLPGGARGTALAPKAMGSLLTTLPCWRDIAGISDGLLAGSGGSKPTASTTPSLEECLLRSWTGPFGIMIAAAPLPPAELRTLADAVARRQHLAEGAADRFPERAVEGRRLAERHAELRRGISTGFWRIQLAAGGTDPANAARVAALFCASAGLDGLPYTLSPAPMAEDAPAGQPDDSAAPTAPFRGSTELLAALARPPQYEVPGVRLALRPDFDVTPEVPGTAEGISLGQVLDGNLMPAGPFRLPLESLNRHVFVCGATGAGKSQTVRSILEAATAHGIPWLVVEPAKAEYRLMANRLDNPEVVRIRPGEADAIAAGLNPLEPAVDSSGNRFPLQTHADFVKALFIASFRSEEPFPQVLSAALTRVYEEAGWDLALGEPRNGRPAGYPALTDLQRAAECVVGEIGYSQRVTDDVLGFIRVRLASLRQGTTGRFLEGGHQIDFGKLLRKNAVLELEDVGDDRDKAFLMGTVLIRLAEHLRLAHRVPDGRAPERAARLSHLTVVEEAHRLLRRLEGAEAVRAGAAAYAVEMFAGLLAEIRAYGEGLVIAEQIPARLVPDVLKNTAIKITHRLPAADDRDVVGATMNATAPQSRYLVTLPPGRAAAFTDGMDFPVLVMIPDGTEREVATAAATLDAASVVTPRSVTCGADCAARPCTLREMRAAQRMLEAHQWVRLWAELTVLAHLAGWLMPVPNPARLAEFMALPSRLGECAVSHAVDAAVAARGPLIESAVSTSALAAHVCAAIRARADRGVWICPPGEPEWRLADPVTEAVAFGMARPSAIEAAAGAVTGQDFAGRLAAALGDFVDCRWPLPYLAGEILDGRVYR